MMRGFSLKLTRRWWWSSYCGNLMRGGGDMWETAAHRSNSTVDALNAEVGKTHRQWGITFLAIFGDSLTPFAESLSFAQLHAGRRRRRRRRSWSTTSYVREVLCSESLRVTWLVINKQALLELRILVPFPCNRRCDVPPLASPIVSYSVAGSCLFVFRSIRPILLLLASLLQISFSFFWFRCSGSKDPWWCPLFFFCLCLIKSEQ